MGEAYDQETVGLDWIGSWDVDALDVYPGAVLGLVTRDGLGTGASYSGAGNRRIRDEQCLCSSSRRPIGAALQPGRDDAAAGASAHGRGTDRRWIDEFHQSDWRDGSW